VEHAPQLALVDALVLEPREHLRPIPRGPVELRLDALGKDASQVAEDAPAGDVRERLDVRVRAQRPNVVDVETVGREQELGVEVVLADELADEGEAVRVQTGGGEADDRVSVLAARAVDEVRAVDEADARAREVELVRSV